MPRSGPFDEFSKTYEEWFEINRLAYESELRAVKHLLPKVGRGIEIGVGSGRFAAPLGIKIGVEPSARMRSIAGERGIEAVNGRAEDLPFGTASFDFALMVTTICFLDDIEASFGEVRRVLKAGGHFVIGFVDKESRIGLLYQRFKYDNPFYRIATFYSVPEVVHHLKSAGFTRCRFVQTVFHDLSSIHETEPVKEGYGEGSFVVIQSQRNES